jgi:hypothetical protein
VSEQEDKSLTDPVTVEEVHARSANAAQALPRPVTFTATISLDGPDLDFILELLRQDRHLRAIAQEMIPGVSGVIEREQHASTLQVRLTIAARALADKQRQYEETQARRVENTRKFFKGGPLPTPGLKEAHEGQLGPLTTPASPPSSEQ